MSCLPISKLSPKEFQEAHLVQQTTEKLLNLFLGRYTTTDPFLTINNFFQTFEQNLSAYLQCSFHNVVRADGFY